MKGGRVRIDNQVRPLLAPPQIPRRHRNDGLTQALIVSAILYDHGGSRLRLSRVGEREVHDDDIASADHGFLP
jgi:hypothetical protein